MYLIIGLSGIVGIMGIVYVVRYYMLVADLKSAQEQMEDIRQNPEDNRILLVAHANNYMERLLAVCNQYIKQNQKERIFYENRERKLRRQIEAISHDLRTPLTSMLGYLELLPMDNLDDESRQSLEVVQRKAKNLQRLLTNFYDLSRLELDDYHLVLERVELSRLVKEEILLSFTSLEERGLEVTVDCGEAVMVEADKDAMERILGNMLQNAVRYATSYLKISVKRTEGEKVQIIFENDSAALKEEDVSHLFERFYMSDASRNGQGTGLGLTISKLLAESMGGSVEAQFENNVLQIRYTFPILV